MLFERSSALRQIGRAVASIAIVAALAGCQARPLYSSAGGVPVKMAAIKINPLGDRVGQEVRNRLVFLTGGGAGEPTLAEYQLQLSVTSTRANILDDEIAAAVLPGRVTVSATYALTRIKDGQVLKSATRSSTALLDLSNQEFAKLRAYRDAENRAANEVAEFVRADLAMALSK
ncbi:LPS assembly lipoprotein LptE [Rhizobium lemnae]|uniref:LPS assembly lipoprotein LptE n=1 Tax=Rhizobium lemnae TaxID=1214924 RepID=A0ABV8E7G0_9HYPH|nr:LPS assembly lipoprotein LptE [Rhizobium lemnae]MCJ8508457.1 LPS assembly lipoprotein LptE [Rhizobium lemnae]